MCVVDRAISAVGVSAFRRKPFCYFFPLRLQTVCGYALTRIFARPTLRLFDKSRACRIMTRRVGTCLSYTFDDDDDDVPGRTVETPRSQCYYYRSVKPILRRTPPNSGRLRTAGGRSGTREHGINSMVFPVPSGQRTPVPEKRTGFRRRPRVFGLSENLSVTESLGSNTFFRHRD